MYELSSSGSLSKKIVERDANALLLSLSGNSGCSSLNVLDNLKLNGDEITSLRNRGGGLADFMNNCVKFWIFSENNDGT